MQDDRLPAVVQQFRRGDAADACGDRPQVLLGGADCTDYLRLNALEIFGIDAARERVRAPHADGVRAVVIVRAAHEDVGETREVLADALHGRQEQPDEIGRGDGDLRLAVPQHDRADHQRVEDFGRLPVLAEPGEINWLDAEGGRDVGLAEAGFERRLGRESRIHHKGTKNTK